MLSLGSLFLPKISDMLSNTGVRYGLLGGAVVVFYFILLYSIKQEYFLSLLLQWGSLGFYLLFMWQAAKVDCAANGISRDFREILRTPFIVFLLINLCYWLFYYALHLYDPSLLQAETEMGIKAINEQLKEIAGDPEKTNLLHQQLEKAEMALKSPQVQPLGDIITSMFIGALGGFGLAAGVAALIRSKD